ncbi:zinc finger protein 511 isoform X2 [Ipomoea triloba]|uniref:zinc finger protein 511 isoform X2 n=1 Tax=Ipomoea triloba TaxID=35885 RepID=UPI00125D0470|nr:zinc finger protein 511 isoform X2 [Ipomoea triloba]
MAMELERAVRLEFPFWSPARRRYGPDDPFFAAGNIERQLLAKQVALDLTEAEKQVVRNMDYGESSDVFCPIIGCGAWLRCLDDFEDHYNARHSASCSVCSRVYPTSRLLSIHISEAHDSFFKAKVARGFAMYECLVEGCGAKLNSYKIRQQHLVDKHKFPASYEFFRKAHPSKKRRQKNQQRQASFKTEQDSNAMQVEDEAMDKLVSAVSKLSTSDSPSTISFGRNRNRGLAFMPRAVQCERTPRPDSSQCSVGSALNRRK